MAKFGIVTAQGVNNVLAVIERLKTTSTENEWLPDPVALTLAPLVACLRDLRVRIKALEGRRKKHRADGGVLRGGL